VICNCDYDKQAKSSRFIDVPQIFLPLKSVALPEKKLKNTRTVEPTFFTYGDSTRAPTRQFIPNPPLARECNTPISSYQLPRAPFPCSRVTLCFRRSGISGSYIRAAAAGTSTLSSLFPRAKFRQVLLRYDISACTTYIRVGCLAVETYCTVCTSTWSFAVIHLACRVNVRRVSVVALYQMSIIVIFFHETVMICDIRKIM